MERTNGYRPSPDGLISLDSPLNLPDGGEIDLNELENDAFITSRHHELCKTIQVSDLVWERLPPGAKSFFAGMTLSRFMILMICGTCPIYVWVLLTKTLTRTVTIPQQSRALSAQLAQSLAGTDIPSYVLTYAPLVHLDESEDFFPSDMLTLTKNTYPALNLTKISSAPESLNLDNLDTLNELGGSDIYLTSKEYLPKTPKYLYGKVPNPKTLQTENAKSCVIIVNDLGAGVIHAFYMYWYIYNKGPVVAGREFENHLGDWEHNMILFEDGEPKAIWYSQHVGGAALSYTAVEKLEKRPVAYSAMGTHANYPNAAWQDLHKMNPKIPKNIAFDHTSKGALWDPTLSAYFYTYSNSNNSFTPVLPNTPVNYLYFQGRWGDKRYPDEDPRQVNFHGIVKFDDGPKGPLSKDLNRTNVCRKEGEPCVILKDLSSEEAG